MTKVYTGTTTIEEHIDKLTELYGYKPRITLRDEDNNTPKQSIEVQRLKREAGLLKD